MNNIREHIVEKIVDTPFMFMKENIESMDLDSTEKYNFYHKGLGRFYFKKEVLKKLKKHGRRKRI